MDERTAGAVREALREAADRAGSGAGGVDAVVRGAVHRGRARLRRRQRLVRAGAALALLTGGGAVVAQLPLGSSAESGSTAASGGGGGGGEAAASASAPSGEAAAPDALQDTTTAESRSLAAVPAGAFTAVPTVDGSFAVLQRSPPRLSASDAAIVTGTLTVVDGGCLGFRYEDGTRTVVVWPSDTTALPDAVGVEVPGMGAYRLGDAVEGGGGYGEAAFEGPLAGCPSTEVAYLNEDQG